MNKNNQIIKDKIELENSKAELFSTYAQFVFLMFILFVYLLSPKGFSQTQFEPVKLAFWIYLPVLCVRWFLVSRDRLRNWQEYVFIVIDVFILTGLIWSFHLQYASPLTLSLRSPTFLYYFVFLSLRALSFRISHVVVFVLAFIVSWSSMVFLALHSSDLQISRSFKDILLPNTFILGVEIDKMLALLMGASVIAFSIYRKRLLLVQLAEQFVREGAMQSLLGKGTLNSFDLLKDELKPGTFKRKIGATLVVDLRGFSRLSYQVPSEKLLILLGNYQQAVVQKVSEHNGVVDKYLGDGILIHFGIASDLPLFASKALKAVEEINQSLQSWVNELSREGIEVGYGIALAQGEVVFGVIGHPDKMEITVIGESVNFASKLEKYTKSKSESILIQHSIFNDALEQGYLPKLKIVNYVGEHIDGLPGTHDLVGLSHSFNKV